MKPLLVKLVPNFLTASNHRSDAHPTYTNGSVAEEHCMEEQQNTKTSRLSRLKRLQPIRWPSDHSTLCVKPARGIQPVPDLERGRTFSIAEENAHELQQSDKMSATESDISHHNPHLSIDSRANPHNSTELMLPAHHTYFLQDTSNRSPNSANTSRTDPDAVSITESEKELFGISTPNP